LKGVNNLLISETSSIEGMRIVREIGYIEAKANFFSTNTWRNARENLVKQAEELGANAIVDLKVKDIVGFNFIFDFFSAQASGTAVIVEYLKK
jgi:uncharacterized protein YbjQ (UPF0145 family)